MFLHTMDRQDSEEDSISDSDHGDEKPRAMIHRKILDIADANPAASPDAIASRVNGVSAEFVERVLNQYGDPSEEGRPPKEPTVKDGSTDSDAGSDREETASLKSTPAGTSNENENTGAETEDRLELNGRQRETLVAVAHRPTATQEEIADELGVSRATVSKRLSGIEEFEWGTRRQFVRQVFDYRGGSGGTSTGNRDETERGQEIGASSEQFEQLAERVDTLESQVRDISHTDGGEMRDPELIQKVAHACMDADYIETSEELRVLDALLSGSTDSR